MLVKIGVGREGDNRGWDGWMASPTRWTCVWASSGSWWWTGKPGVLQSMKSESVMTDWTELKEWCEHFISLGEVAYPSNFHIMLIFYPLRTPGDFLLFLVAGLQLVSTLSETNIIKFHLKVYYSMHICCCSVAKSCLTLCDSMDCSIPGFPVLHYLLEFAQTQNH